MPLSFTLNQQEALPPARDWDSDCTDRVGLDLALKGGDPREQKFAFVQLRPPHLAAQTRTRRFVDVSCDSGRASKRLRERIDNNLRWISLPADYLPKDVLRHFEIAIVERSEKDVSSSFRSFDVSEAGEPEAFESFDPDVSGKAPADTDCAKPYRATLQVPFAKCWTLCDARALIPDLSDAEYCNGKLELGTMLVHCISADIIESGVGSNQWDHVYETLLPEELDDGTVRLPVAECVEDMLRACTRIEDLSASQTGEEPVFKSFPVQRDKLGLIFIRRLEIHGIFRGQGYGKLLMNEGLRSIEERTRNATGPVYVKPFPLRWEGVKSDGCPPSRKLETMCDAEMDPDGKFWSDRQKMQLDSDIARTIEWWKQRGFWTVDGHEYRGTYLVRGVST